MASEAPVIVSSHVIRGPEFLSPSTTNALSYSNPQAATISGASVTTSMATVGVHNGVQHLDVTIHLELRLRRAPLDPSLPMQSLVELRYMNGFLCFSYSHLIDYGH